MSVESVVELCRKANFDYAIATNDDEKCLILDKQVVNLFVENLKNKRDRSPSTCQNNADTANETVDCMRIHAEKKPDNNHTIQLDGNAKRQKTVCYDFKKGICRRRFCRVSKIGAYVLFFCSCDEYEIFIIFPSFNSQYPHVMNADQVIFCHDFQNNGCFRANCR